MYTNFEPEMADFYDRYSPLQRLFIHWRHCELKWRPLKFYNHHLEVELTCSQESLARKMNKLHHMKVLENHEN